MWKNKLEEARWRKYFPFYFFYSFANRNCEKRYYSHKKVKEAHSYICFKHREDNNTMNFPLQTMSYTTMINMYIHPKELWISYNIIQVISPSFIIRRPFSSFPNYMPIVLKRISIIFFQRVSVYRFFIFDPFSSPSSACINIYSYN